MPRTIPLGPVAPHLARIRDMARATGVDLAEAQREGRLQQPEWSEAVTRCRGCQIVPDCDRFRAEPVDAPRRAPRGCRNVHMMERLARD